MSSFLCLSRISLGAILSREKNQNGVDGEKIKSGDGGIEVGYRRRVGGGNQTFLHTKYLIKVNN